MFCWYFINWISFGHGPCEQTLFKGTLILIFNLLLGPNKKWFSLLSRSWVDQLVPGFKSFWCRHCIKQGHLKSKFSVTHVSVIIVVPLLLRRIGQSFREIIYKSIPVNSAIFSLYTCTLSIFHAFITALSQMGSRLHRGNVTLFYPWTKAQMWIRRMSWCVFLSLWCWSNNQPYSYDHKWCTLHTI